jgi:hypothetical protein
MGYRLGKPFRVTGYVLSALAFAGFAVKLLFEVLSGNSAETYRSVALVEWTYGGALIVLVLLGLLAFVGLALKIYERWRG